MPEVGKRAPKPALAEPEPVAFVDADLLDPAAALDAAVSDVPEPVGVQTQASAASLQATVQALHDDEVALGFLHAGGMCGCRYIVTTALRHLGVEVVE